MFFLVFETDEKPEPVAEELLFDYRGFFMSFVPKSRRMSTYSVRNEGDKETVGEEENIHNHLQFVLSFPNSCSSLIF